MRNYPSGIHWQSQCHTIMLKEEGLGFPSAALELETWMSLRLLPPWMLNLAWIWMHLTRLAFCSNSPTHLMIGRSWEDWEFPKLIKETPPGTKDESTLLVLFTLFFSFLFFSFLLIFIFSLSMSPPETLQKIKERTRLAMQNPKVMSCKNILYVFVQHSIQSILIQYHFHLLLLTISNHTISLILCFM